MSKNEDNPVLYVVEVPRPLRIGTRAAEKPKRKRKRANPKKLQLRPRQKMRVNCPHAGKAKAGLEQYMMLRKMGFTHDQIGELYELGRRNSLRKGDD